jgi:hypothetical protein
MRSTPAATAASTEAVCWPDPIVGLAGRHHEEGPDTRQGPPHRFGIFVGGFGHPRPGKVGGATPVANDQPLAMT